MSDKVSDKLIELNEKVQFVPVTSRSLEEYTRVNLGVKPEYAIVSNGGILLRNGEVDKDWEDYVKSHINYQEAMNLMAELEDETESIETNIKVIDNVYLFCKTTQHKMFDQEVLYFMSKYTDWEFTRQENKVYIIPKVFSKQVALRYLWHRLDRPYIVASGDGLLDLGMLTLANKAIVPSHSELISGRYITSCDTAKGGIISPLYTMEKVEEILEKGE